MFCRLMNRTGTEQKDVDIVNIQSTNHDNSRESKVQLLQQRLLNDHSQ